MDTLPTSEDDSIERLLEEGYALYRRGPYLVAAVTYLDGEGKARSGLMVDTLNLDADGRARTLPINHQMYFVGDQPYDQEGRVLFKGQNASSTPLFDGKVSSFYWSWKPLDDQGRKRDYTSLYEKFSDYIVYVASPVEAKFPHYKVTPFEGVGADDSDCPFPFADMNSARANLGALDARLADDSVVIIGAGGTGSYIFDLMAKTRVKTIRLIDFDVLDLHNAFRMPGATRREELGQPKVRVIEQRYDGWHNGTEVLEAELGRASVNVLGDATFAFLAVDKVAPRRDIAKLLLSQGIPVAVVGMGLHHGKAGLVGMVDTTLLDETSPRDLLEEIVGAALTDIPDEYQKNIQTVELNAMNAAMAVFMYKKYRGYFAGDMPVCQASFTLSTMQLDREFAR